MSNPSELLFNAIASLMKTQNKQFLASHLATRLASVEEDLRFRYDPVARNIYAQIAKVAETDPGRIISGNQIAQYYKEIESLNPQTEFKEEYSDLFPGSEIQAIPEVSENAFERSRHEYYDEPTAIGETATSIDEDQELTAYEAPEFAIGAQFDPKLHRFAEVVLHQALEELGANNIRLAHKTNAPGLMVYQANFVTPTGKHNTVVPIQVKDDLVLLPQVFGAHNNSYTLTKTGFASFEKDNMRLAEIKAMNAADQLRHAEHTDASRNPTALDTFMNTEEEIVEDDDLQLLEGDPDVTRDIESHLASTMMIKQSAHEPRAITKAMESVTRKLRTAGQHSPIRFAGDGEHGDLLFQTKIVQNHRTANVTIPVETRGSQVLLPNVFTINDKTYDLSERGITAAFEQAPEQARFDLETTDLARANYKTLRQVVYASAMKGNSASAQFALEVIANKFGNDAVSATMNDYAQWLRTASVQPNHTVEKEMGYKMSADDWAATLQAEIKNITGSTQINVSPELDTIRFEQYDDPGFEGVITTNKIDNIELT